MWWIPAIAAVVVLGFVGTLMRVSRQRAANRMMAEAKETFRRRREWLEARFVDVASSAGKPRGLKWEDCEFENEVEFARDRASGELRAFVGVTIKFSAIEDGGMEHVEAVDNHKAATAVFHFSEGKWDTLGRAVFNLSPSETIQHFVADLEPLAERIS